jgi:hypothetical protein
LQSIAQFFTSITNSKAQVHIFGMMGNSTAFFFFQMLTDKLTFA